MSNFIGTIPFDSNSSKDGDALATMFVIFCLVLFIAVGSVFGFCYSANSTKSNVTESVSPQDHVTSQDYVPPQNTVSPRVMRDD